MGHQQLLFVIVGLILIGIAIAVGILMFGANSVETNKQAMINDLNNLASCAYRHHVRPVSMDGGGGDLHRRRRIHNSIRIAVER